MYRGQRRFARAAPYIPIHTYTYIGASAGSLAQLHIHIYTYTYIGASAGSLAQLHTYLYTYIYRGQRRFARAAPIYIYIYISLPIYLHIYFHQVRGDAVQFFGFVLFSGLVRQMLLMYAHGVLAMLSGIS